MFALILSAIVGLLIFGMIGGVSAENDSGGCKNLYWIDNTHKDCSQQQFCGAYMYLGLQTFETKEKCLRAVNKTDDEDDDESETEDDEDDEIDEDAGCRNITVKAVCESRKKCEYNNLTGKCDKTEREREREREHNKFRPWQKRNQSECPDGCKCRGAVVSCETEDGKIMNITAGNSGKIITIEVNKIKVNTTLELETEADDNNKTKIILNLPDGRNVTLKILPERAAERARERLGEMNYTLELKQTTITKGNETKVVYEVVGEKPGKFLGLFKTKGKMMTTVDAETGEIVKVKKPWWGFLASEI